MNLSANFIKLKDEDGNPVYIRISSIIAIYTTDNGETTDIDYGFSEQGPETMTVKDKVDDIARRIY